MFKKREKRKDGGKEGGAGQKEREARGETERLRLVLKKDRKKRRSSGDTFTIIEFILIFYVKNVSAK